MGGHSAWRKRVERGELAKGSGGAIMRHRPHLGRKGKDLILNRKGHIGGGNPKKMKKTQESPQETVSNVESSIQYRGIQRKILWGILVAYFVSLVVAALHRRVHK